MDNQNNPTYADYLSFGFTPLLCKGYHPEYNPKKDYKIAKQPVSSGWTLPDYIPPRMNEIQAWEKNGGWTGWLVPKGFIVPDVEDPEAIARVREVCGVAGIDPGVHQSNNGLHFLFLSSSDLSASSKVFTKCGIEVTYRVGGKNYLILAPINGRKWELWKNLKNLPMLPDEFLPYDKKSVDDVLNCLSWQVGKAYGGGYLSGYEDLDAAYMALLIDCKLSAEQIRRSFEITFRQDYDERQTVAMYERTRMRIEKGDPIIGTGTFIQRVKEQGLREVERFARELQTVTGSGRITVSEEWPDPIPFDEYSLLPDFPTDALSGVGQEIVQAASEVIQVDPALPACEYLAALSACCSKKAEVDLVSHKEPLNLYLSPVLDSGNRRSRTDSVMTRPLYEFQKARQEDMKKVIEENKNIFKIKEKRLEKLQKKAAEKEDPKKRRQFEIEAAELTRELVENPVPISPIYLVDDVTPEKLGALMADNGERMAVITTEGGLLDIMAGRYSKNGIGNIDLFLKAHAGDYWSYHRVGREPKTMQAPALTLCLAVQSKVIEEAGENDHFRGKGLLARFLYSKCKSQIGYRERQTISIPPSLSQRYNDHIFSLMNIPFTESDLRLSEEAQALWDQFYNDIEREMRPGESLQYLADWGSKLPGAVARIAGLLHFAEHGAKGLNMPISVNSVSASCVIGAYFKEHAIAVFGLMQEDNRIKVARQILGYLGRERPETFKGRDIMHHTGIAVMEGVEQGLKVLIDRGYVREEVARVPNKADNPGPGRPSAKTYRVNPKVFERKNV